MNRDKENQYLRDSLAKVKRMLRKQEALLGGIDRWILQIEKTDKRAGIGG